MLMHYMSKQTYKMLDKIVKIAKIAKIKESKMFIYYIPELNLLVESEFIDVWGIKFNRDTYKVVLLGAL
jgi:hypothetical protein